MEWFIGYLGGVGTMAIIQLVWPRKTAPTMITLKMYGETVWFDLEDEEQLRRVLQKGLARNHQRPETGRAFYYSTSAPKEE